MADQAIKLLRELRNAIDEITVVDSVSGERTNAKETGIDLNENIGYTLEKVDDFLSDSHEIQIVQIACPHCQTEYEIADNLVGRNATCERCGNNFSTEPEHRTPFTKTILFKDSDTIKLIKAEYQKNQTKWWQFWK